MTLLKKTIIAASVLAFSAAGFADHHEGDKKDKMNAGDAPTMSLVSSGIILPWGLTAHEGIMPWGIGPGPMLSPWSIFDPYLLDIPGGEGKGMPVYSADDPKKIIGYMKIPAAQKPKGPVHCMIKETGLLAKSVGDCEAAGGTVAK